VGGGACAQTRPKARDCHPYVSLRGRTRVRLPEQLLRQILLAMTRGVMAARRVHDLPGKRDPRFATTALVQVRLRAPQCSWAESFPALHCFLSFLPVAPDFNEAVGEGADPHMWPILRLVREGRPYMGGGGGHFFQLALTENNEEQLVGERREPPTGRGNE
jgi:hypothetical protein